MRIDMHVHYMPPSAKLDPTVYAQEPFWQLLLDDPNGRSVQGWATAERMIEDMNAAGVDQAVIQGEYLQTHEATTRKNELVIQAVRESGGRLLGFASIQPRAGSAAMCELERCLDNGMIGVGELSPYAQGFQLSDPDFLRIAERCVEYRIPLLLHTNDDIGRYYRGRVPIPIRHYYELARRFPDLKLILAHWGGGLFLYEIVPGVREVLQNVVYDTAASPLTYPTASIFRAALACVPADKIVYASDYPLLVYPRRQTQPDFLQFLGEIQDLGLDEKTEAAILGENALTFLSPSGKGPVGTSVHKRHGIDGADAEIREINDSMSVAVIANAFPATRDIFVRHDIEWQDVTVPPWEPIRQAAAARGLNAEKTNVLVLELNDAVKAQHRK